MCVHTWIKPIEETTPFRLRGIDTFVIVLMGHCFDETTKTFTKLKVNRSLVLLNLDASTFANRIGQIKLSSTN